MPNSFLTKLVLSSLEREHAFPRLDVIDLSCGEGEVVEALRELGCRARGTRYKKGDYIIRSDRLAGSADAVVDGVDLTRPLPFESASADAVIMTEVIEHLPEHATVIREAARVLRPGGILILSTPNIHRLHSRIRFLLTGAHKLICRRPGWDTPRDELYRFHISPAYLPLLHTILRQEGLEIERIRISRVKVRHLYAGALYPFVVLASLVEYLSLRGDPEYKRGERALMRWMTHPAVLFSEQLFLAARAVRSAKE